MKTFFTEHIAEKDTRGNLEMVSFHVKFNVSVHLCHVGQLTLTHDHI